MGRALWTGKPSGKVAAAPLNWAYINLVMSDLATQWSEEDILKLRWVEMAEELWVLKTEVSISE